ncbi:O-antigen ligase family protein [Acanthopleuribacter pedis]|uniref:O-antigen ligase family protein n=1 Tax=Acanthopleuribacter pedis TaxID=442870 RepID=A0A8J7U0U4_9BACT|nr:O-antigen ligase family protein [Acanthopleuribacter pedis]MBO1316877.1 O-antigen ligase family protein [Acanthopleuribacter pedis]
MEKKSAKNYRSQVDLIWTVLFIDIAYLFLRFGGNAYLDQLIHGFFVAVLAVMLIRLRRQLRYPRAALPICYGALALALFQWIPLGSGLSALLSPVKSDMQQAVTALYPEITTTTSIAIVPQLHGLETASWCLDLFLVFFLFLVPRPRRELFFRGFYGIGILVCGLAVGVDNPISSNLPPFTWYAGTYGGLVNRNHFALLAVGLVLMSYYQILVNLSIFWRERKKLRQNADRAAKRVIALVSYIMAFVFFFFTFTQTWSRAGVVGFLLGHLVLLVLLTWHYLRNSRRRKWLVPAMALGFVGILLFLPLGTGFERLKQYGLEDQNRLSLLSIGMGYVQKAPLFGSGLGAPQEIIDPVEPRYLIITRNMRHFHNEYLELLVETGPLGLLALLAFLAFLGWETASGLSEEDEKRKLMAVVLLSCFIVFCMAAFVAFPLQTPAMRCFVLAVMFYGLKYIHQDDSVYKVKHADLLKGLPLLVIGLLVPLSWLPHYLNDDLETHKAEQARRYGFFYREAFLEANGDIQAVFMDMPPAETLQAQIPEMRAQLVTYLEAQPFGLKALNSMFVLELLEERLKDPAFTEEQYNRFHQKALALQEIGRDANFHAVASLYFLGSVYEGHVPEAHRAAWEELKNHVHIRRFASRKKQEMEQAEENPPEGSPPEGADQGDTPRPVGELSELRDQARGETLPADRLAE